MTRAATPFSRGLLLLVVAAAIVARASTLPNGFVNYDDLQVRHAVAGADFADLWTGPFYFAYKPVYATSLWLDERVYGNEALGWHAGNVVLFALCCALLALVVHGMTRSAFAGAAVGLLLATHPVHAENVAWVSERKDVLSLALVLLAHLAWRRARSRDPSRLPLLALFLFVLGGLAKGTVWTYAGVIALDEVLAGPGVGRRARLFALAAVAVLGVALDVWVGIRFGPGAVRHDATTIGLVAAMSGVHARYLASLLWPFGLSVDYPVDPAGSFADPFAVLGLLLAVLAVVGLVHGLRRGRPWLALACGLWILGLLPVNNVWPTTAILRADRYLLIPAIGVYLLLAALLLRAKSAGPVVLGALVVALGIGAHLRGPVWADSESLWTDALEKAPNSAVAWVNRAQARAETGAFVGAEDDARRGIAAALALRRGDLVVRGRLLRSQSLSFLGRVPEALDEANRAVAAAEGLPRSPGIPEPVSTLADAHARVGLCLVERSRLAEGRDVVGDRKLAAAEFRRAIALDPNCFDAQLGLGNLLAPLAGTSDEKLAIAAKALREADRILPGSVEVAVPLVGVLSNMNLPTEAQAVFDRAMARNPESRDLLLLHAHLKDERDNDADAAAKDYARILARNPHDADAPRLLASLWKRRGREALILARTQKDPALLSKAVLAFDRALAVDPHDAESQWLAGDALLVEGKFREARERYRKAGAAAGARWVKSLEARAGVLEAVALARAGLPDEAAKAMASVVRLSPPRIDLGATLLEAEVLWLVPAVEALEGGAPAETPLATSLLLGAAALVAGDDAGALAAFERAAGFLGSSPPRGSRLEALYDAAYLLRALARAGRIEIAAARDDLRLVLPHRERDPVLRYHLLLLDRTEATARLRIAEGVGEPAALEKARAAAADVTARIRAFASEDAPWPGPGLLAAETEIEAQDFVAASRRLSALRERFPESPAVYRAIAAVYQTQVLAGGDRGSLFTEARAALLEAKELDPRDPRTALDLSQLYRLLGNLDAAAQHALAAMSVEPAGGPASRALAAILVERGRKALEARAYARALELAASARSADPVAAGPDVLEGDVMTVTDPKTGRPDLDKALAAYRHAREKEPASRAAISALAGCHRRRGATYFVWRVKTPRPAEKGGVLPDPAAVAAWDANDAAFRRLATSDLEAALRLDPDGEGADTAARQLESIRRLDPDEERKRVLLAESLFGEGEALRKAGKRLEALEKYRASVDAFSDSLRGWMRIAEMSVALGTDHDVTGLAAIENVRDLDAERRFPEPDLYAGEIWARRADAFGKEEFGVDARQSAERALVRFLARTSGIPAQEENRRRATSLLARVRKGP